MIKRKKIIVCYLRADSLVLQDHILNKMAANLAPTFNEDERPPIVHVELFFPDPKSNETGLSAGICYGGQAFMHPKRFSRPNWEFHSIPVTDEQLAKAKEFCNRQRGASFNYRGFFLPKPCGVGHTYRAANLMEKRMTWYCSELCAYALFHADVLNSEQAFVASSHPNAAHHVIENQCDTYIDCARNIQASKLQL